VQTAFSRDLDQEIGEEAFDAASDVEGLVDEDPETAKKNARKQQASKVALARLQGYEGEACGECGNFTMVRNGTCLKCDTCGSTSGCS